MKKITFGMVVLFFLSLLALSDTIYLKSGRIIRTPFSEVVGNKVRFIIRGGEVMLPLSLVEKIVKDAYTLPPKSESSAAPPPPTKLGQEGTPPETKGEKAPPSVGTDNPEAQKKQATYWIKRREQITESLQKAEAQLSEARRRLRFSVLPQERGALVKQINQLEKAVEKYRNELNNLGTEAKKHGVLPGELRKKEKP